LLTVPAAAAAAAGVIRQHTDPEIANTPLEGVVLLLKAMGVDKVCALVLCHSQLALDVQAVLARSWAGGKGGICTKWILILLNGILHTR
jgi:hypothetical protein